MQHCITLLLARPFLYLYKYKLLICEQIIFRHNSYIENMHHTTGYAIVRQTDKQYDSYTDSRHIRLTNLDSVSDSLDKWNGIDQRSWCSVKRESSSFHQIWIWFRIHKSNKASQWVRNWFYCKTELWFINRICVNITATQLTRDESRSMEQRETTRDPSTSNCQSPTTTTSLTPVAAAAN